jgi:hypothetical protein
MIMGVVFINDCAVDGCGKKNMGKGSQMCKEHQAKYNAGEKLIAFYGKTVQKKEFQTPST